MYYLFQKVPHIRPQDLDRELFGVAVETPDESAGLLFLEYVADAGEGKLQARVEAWVESGRTQLTEG